jgi:AcrR family transcriptional regulator
MSRALRKPAPIQQARDQMYEALILDIAETLFAELGVDGCQVKDVATRAGISLATLYRYFASKEELLEAVHERRLTQLMGRILEAVRDQRSPLDAILAANEIHLRFHMEHPSYLGMHLREGNAWFDASKLRCRAQIEAVEEGHKRTTASFAAGIRAGVFVNDPPALMARASVAANHVHLAHWVLGGRVEAPDVVVARARAHFMRAFCKPERRP